jgi:hypothetical protein
MELMFGILPPPQVEIPPSARVICSSVLHDVDWSRVSAASAFVVVVVAQCRASASPLHCRIRDALEPELRVKRLPWQGHSDGGIDAKANDVLRVGHSLHAAGDCFGDRANKPC